MRTDERTITLHKEPTIHDRARRWARAISLASVLLILMLGTSACFLTESQRRIGTAFVYTGSGGTDVKVTYTVPPPPAGKVYVLWVLNPSTSRSAKVGQVPPGSGKIARAQVNFKATGVVVSIEDNAGVQRMGNTWALRSGEIEASSRSTR